MKTSASKNIAFAGIMLALLAALLYVETVLTTPLFAITPAFITIPLALSISVFDKSKKWYGGTMLGLVSFGLSFVIGAVPFMNPLISVLPRVFMGLVAYYSYEIFSSITAGSKNKFIKEVLPLALAGALGALFNTVTVISLIYIFHTDAIAAAIRILITINAPFELLIAAILVPAIAKVFIRVSKKTGN